jgi:DNA-binding response OmpR family regulator
MAPQSIVIVEDEVTIAGAIAARLRREGFAVEIASDGPAGIELCERERPDLVILDLMLPGLDGLEVCRRIQARSPVPVLMLTARDSEADKLVGVGADDYMTKPFSVRELVARIRAILRRIERSRTTTSARVTFGDLDVDPRTRRVTRGDKEIHLTPIEFDLLYRMASDPEVVFSRDQLMREVWGYDDVWGARTVDSHVAALRRKLGPDVLRTVHGVGYALAHRTDATT